METLKMQGVEQFGEYGIRIRLKIMTKPGEQFVVRRRAYALIKKAFEANGINFALPKVHVAGGDEGGRAAAAHEGLSVVQPPKIDFDSLITGDPCGAGTDRATCELKWGNRYEAGSLVG